MKKIAILLTMSVLTACELNDSPSSMNNSPGAQFLNQLTGGTGNSKAWKIESATVKSPNNELSISNLANVKDDEFVFSAVSSGQDHMANVDWKIRNEIRANVSKPEDALLDYYLSSLKTQLTIQDNGVISTSDPNLQVEVVSENHVSVRYKKGTSELRLDLTARISENSDIPSTLQFEKISEINGKGLEQAAGFTGSMASNSLYIAYRTLEGSALERVIKYDINSGTYISHDFNHPDFVTKELHIINDELKVVGAQYVNTYSLDLSREPISVAHNLTLTRYGSTVVDNNVFLFGGDIVGTNADKIYKHDQLTGKLNEVGSLPESRFFAHGEIMDAKLYVFGGRQTFTAEEAEDDIFVRDMTTGENKTFKLPTAIDRTFTSRYKHLIIVGGQRNTTSNGSWAIETTFGVFNTHDNTFTKIPSSFNSISKETIYGLTVVNDKVYVLYGSFESSIFSIYEATL